MSRRANNGRGTRGFNVRGPCIEILDRLGLLPLLHRGRGGRSFLATGRLLRLLAWLIAANLPHFVCPLSAFALGQPQYVESHASPGSFPIARDASLAALFVDTNDFPGVVRAVEDLQADIAR